MKTHWIWLVFLLLLSCSSRETLEVRQTYELYLKSFREKNYDKMWSLLSSKERERIEEQWKLLQQGGKKRVVLHGLVQWKKGELQKLTPKDYFKRIVAAYRRILEEKKEAREIFDLMKAVVEKVEGRGNFAIVTLFDGVRRRKVRMEKEGKEWRVGEEYVYEEKQEES